jgi:TatD DNase family protein
VILIDSHCHIDGEQFDADRDEVVQRARDAGVAAMLNIGRVIRTRTISDARWLWRKGMKTCMRQWAVHPHDAKLYDDAAEAAFRRSR